MSEPPSRLTLKVGSHLGSYEVLGVVGAGGMGDVYRAWDSKLKREVAIKVLPDEFCRDPQRISRFQREAEILASLNHPHIGTIYDIAHHEDLRFLILEFVGGETLAERFARGPLPIPEALAFAKQIAEALEAAHQKGVIHRDLKPANIKVASEGTVKVLDFGLAKSVSDEAAVIDFSQSPTVTGTGEKVIMGTPGYMSPEQARGQHVDSRTDIWSFGCVLYESLTGRSAFAGKTVPDTIAKILEGQPDPVRQLRRDVPGDVERLVMRCLERNADARYASAAELLTDIAKCERRLASPAKALVTAAKRPLVAISIGAVVIAVAILTWFWIKRADEIRRARNESVRQIEMYAEAGDWETAYNLARNVQRVIPNDAQLGDLWPRFSWLVTIPSDPPGAKVFRRPYSAGEDAWEELGTTPLERVHFPFGYSVVRFELPGHTPLIRALGFTTEGSQQLMRLSPFKLDTNESLRPDKVRVPGRPPESLASDEANEFQDFFLGRYEVTNREYKKFIDAGGYERREFWEHPFVKDGKEISWEQAMALFKDKTGRAGPSTWEAGDYPEGRSEYPVSGVSWYEAAAYARFVGEELPTIHHWRFALGVGLGNGSWILPASNLDADGPAPVGKFKGITWSGAYDMIGNAREWCFNAIGGNRVIAGAGWSDESTFYSPAAIESDLPALNRSAENGFRLAITHDEPDTAAKMRLPLPKTVPRDVTAEKLVSNETFEIYRRMYSYDPIPLNAKVEAIDSSRDWTRELVSLDAAYGGERLFLYLYLPRTGSPPYQTLVYYPGGIAFGVDSIDQYRQINLDFVLKSGRALAFPVYKGSFQRRDKVPFAGPSARRQRRIELVNDLRRTIDYLETRKEIDSAKLGYYGYSQGAALGPLFLVLDSRLRAAVLYLGGLSPGTPQPEVDPVTFLPRIPVPVLTISAELDSGFPLQTSAKPFVELLRTPQKKHVIAPGGHFVPRPILIRETLDWFDRYLGPIK